MTQQKKKPGKGAWITGIIAAIVIGGWIGSIGDDSEEPAAAVETVEEETTEPEPVEEETTEPEPVEEETTEPEPVEEEMTREPFTGELTYDETFMLLDMAWEESDGQEDMCWGYDFMGSDWAWDAMTEGATASGIEYDRTAFDNFFLEKCDL